MLKTYLQALLNRFWSKQENASIGAMAYPSPTYIDWLSIGNTKNFQAPKDGWFHISVRSTNLNQFLNVSVFNWQMQEIRSSGTGQLMTLYIPAPKGQSIVVDTDIPNPSWLAVRFYPSSGSA